MMRNAIGHCCWLLRLIGLHLMNWELFGFEFLVHVLRINFLIDFSLGLEEQQFRLEKQELELEQE